jgi:hypothetical protein
MDSRGVGAFTAEGGGGELEKKGRAKAMPRAARAAPMTNGRFMRVFILFARYTVRKLSVCTYLFLYFRCGKKTNPKGRGRGDYLIFEQYGEGVRFFSEIFSFMDGHSTKIHILLI